jgi:hypothetical protein
VQIFDVSEAYVCKYKKNLSQEPTTTSCRASAVKFYKATNSVFLEKKLPYYSNNSLAHILQHWLYR